MTWSDFWNWFLSFFRKKSSNATVSIKGVSSNTEAAKTQVQTISANTSVSDAVSITGASVGTAVGSPVTSIQQSSSVSIQGISGSTGAGNPSTSTQSSDAVSIMGVVAASLIGKIATTIKSVINSKVNILGTSAITSVGKMGTIWTPPPQTNPDPFAIYDGSLGAAVGTAPFPSLLNSYSAHRPPWFVAGVDYAVGQTSGATTFGSLSVNPTQAQLNLASTGATISGSTITLTGANPSLGSASIGFIFATNTTIVVGSGASGTVTIQNCVVTLSGQGGQHIYCANGRTCNMTVLNCEINGSQYPSSTTQFTDVGIYFGATGKLTVQYCYLHGLAIDAIQIQTGNSTFDIRFNAFNGIGYSPNGGSGGHPDFIQHDGNASCSGFAAYNLFYAPVGSGQNGDNEMLSAQAQVGGIGAVLGPIIYINNCIISAGTTAAPTCSLIMGSFVEDTSSTLLGFEFVNNYIDPSGVQFWPPYYGTTAQLQVTTGGINQVYGNMLMTTGLASNPTNVGYVAAGTTSPTTSGAQTKDCLSAVASPATGTETNGNTITFTLTFTRTVTTTGATLTLNNGAIATLTSGSGTTALVFSYTVSSSDTSKTNLAISAINGTILDIFGNSMATAGGLVTFTGLNVNISAIPVITNGGFSVTLPFTNGQTIGTMTATNSPTSWAITAVSGDSASTSDFAISSSGVITATSSAVTDITAAGTVTITVTATNGSGTSSPGTGTVTVNSSSGLNDGLSGAPSGTPQYPALLNSYGGTASRNKGLIGGKQYQPYWNVAGVDYAVGIDRSVYPTDASLKNPNSMSISGVTVNTGSRKITVTGSNVVIDGYDLSTGGEWTVSVAGANCTISNCKFNIDSGTHSWCIFTNSGCNGYTLIKCEFFCNYVNTNSPPAYNGPLQCNQSGTYNITYNYFSQGFEDFIDFIGGTCVLNLHYNMFDNWGQGGHPDVLQMFGSGATYTVDAQFNTIIQSNSVNSGQGMSCQDNSIRPTCLGATYNYNTFALSGGVVTFCIFIDTSELNGPGSIANNFIDPTSTRGGAGPFTVIRVGAAGGGPFSGSATTVGNIDMRYGNTIPANASAPP